LPLAKVAQALKISAAEKIGGEQIRLKKTFWKIILW
jgi:hypothetical protein